MTFKHARRRPVLTEAKHRSKLEDRIADQLTEAGVDFDYEKRTVEYIVPSRKAKYTPDFELKGANKTIIVEAKGRFINGAPDRQKMILVKEQNPSLDIRMVFQRAHLPIYKGSKTTYAKWADDHGFLWADGGKIPQSWIEEVKS